MRAVHSGCWVTTEVSTLSTICAKGRTLDSARRLSALNAPNRPSTSTCLFRVHFGPSIFPACFADASLEAAQPLERDLLSTSSAPTVAQGASWSFRCPSSRHQLGASTCRAENPNSTLRSVHGVPPAFNGLLHSRPHGLVSSRSRVQGSPFRGLTSDAEPCRVILDLCPLAVRDATRRPKPSCFASRPRLSPK
jgi:hypothetical protein